MANENEKIASPRTQLGNLFSAAVETGAFRRLVFSKPQNGEKVRAVLAQTVVNGQTAFQLETFYRDNKARQVNYTRQEAERELPLLLADWLQADLVTTASVTCEWKRSRDGRETLLGGARLMSALLSLAPMPKPLPIPLHDRRKNHILTGSEPFLQLLGVSDEKGRVYDRKQSKFRQINRALELLRDVEDRLPATGTLRVCDLCCGKSYLTFAVYHYLTAVLHRKVVMDGVDLKEDVVAFCNNAAGALHFDGLRFTSGDVAAFEPTDGAHVHLVVSLHACDTATDLVLHKAIGWQSEVILSTPCCHHELNHTIDCPELAAVTRYSMLRQKLCDAATDAMRLLLLEANGYATEALELIDPEETPKNILLRAVRHGQSEETRQKATAAYEEAVRFFIREPGAAQSAFLSRNHF